jgi:hypothetical protein
MFDASVSAVLTALVGAFVGATVVSPIVSELVSIMQAGQFSSAQSAQSIISYLQIVGGNWVRAALVSALMTLLARAVVESRVSST